MATESFLVTALPHSAGPAAEFHVSLFVTHRLMPDGAEGVVADFPHVVDWPDRLAGAVFGLQGRTSAGGTVKIPVTPQLSVLEPKLWPRVFPADLVVRPWETPEPTAIPWQTFPAHRMQQHSLLTHAGSLFSSPILAPTPAGNVLITPPPEIAQGGSPLLSALGLGQFTGFLTVDGFLSDEINDRPVPQLDRITTQYLDRISGGGRPGRGIGSEFSDSFTAFDLFTADAHRARLYYQRPELQQPYLERPVEGAVAEPVAKPKPDFHERASMLADLSPLLRRLGLVIDLHVDDLALLADVVELRATLEVPDLKNTIVLQPATACAVRGLAFFATSATGDYSFGLLRIGAEESFTVLDLDPDASGLKLEQYVRTVPRMVAEEANGDPVSAAPAGLRATGFAVARVDRAEQLEERLSDTTAQDDALIEGKAPPLHLEDVARGIRLEVWDDDSRAWHSLHRRRIDVEVDGAATVLDDEPDTGFLQGASLSRADGVAPDDTEAPYYAHEVVAGWDGWSLSAPRPGLTVVHVDGEEQLLEEPPADPDPVNPVATTTRVEPLTLPRLRYGRRYAMRAWVADLAGNSPPHLVAGPPEGPPDEAAEPIETVQLPRHIADAVDRLAATRSAQVPLDATAHPGAGLATELGRAAHEVVRRGLRAKQPPVTDGPRPGKGAAGLDLGGLQPTGVADLDRLIVSRVQQRFAQTSDAPPTRQAQIEATFAGAAAQVEHLVERTDARPPVAALSEAMQTGIASHPEVLEPETPLDELLELLADAITTPRPFLRWDPILEPAVVPRHPYTEAESLLTLVVRSGVEGPVPVEDGGDGLTLTLVDPPTFAATTLAARPDLGLLWRGVSERHLAPPKVGQLTAELHGLFDAAFGGGSPEQVRTALATALREAGSFLDTTVADLSTPGARLPQPGVSLHTTPTAGTPAVTDPEELPRGEPLTPGQYVVHDVDQLVVPYLPDPLATGLSFLFPDAGQGHRLAGLFAVEGTRLAYAGSWPEPVPWRMVLADGDELGAEVAGNVVRFTVPPGEELRMRLSSALERPSLDLLGLWRSLPEVLRALDLVAEAAADGWFWWLTPGTTLRLVHATPKPVEVPRTTVLVPIRTAGDTAVGLFGGVDLHGPSTERLDVEAGWSEQVDDIAKPGPEQLDLIAAVCQTPVRPDEDLVVLAPADADLPLPDGTTLHLHGAVHQMGDTRHRAVDYTMRATTRFREYFDPRLLPTPDDVSVVGPAFRVDVPSAARPAKPVVKDVLPLFRWEESTEPAHPFGLRRTRNPGLRIYLDRPWFSSGDGELLGVILAFGSDAIVGEEVSQWAADPVFRQEGPLARSVLPLSDLLHLTGLDDRIEPGRPVGPPVARTLVDLPGNPAVWVLGYQPEFSSDRGLWFVDVALDPGTAFWPFVRLSVARYQPSSLPGLHLSPVVRCDFAQLPPHRTATISRPDDRQARVVVTGPVGVPGGLTPVGLDIPSFLLKLASSRTLRARLERRIPEIGTDLGWQAVASTTLPVLGIDGTVVSWAGTLNLPVDLGPSRPGESDDWRVTLEEWERLPADPELDTGALRSEARVVYADHLPL
jgi:hypothetical protein